ncbi:MAG: glutaminase A [Methylococcales bacterium]|nr:glutaminase A [Methylococcales bacterium]
MKPLKKTLQHIFIAVALASGSSVSQAETMLDPSRIKMALQTAYHKYKNIKEGANANYIPILAKVDSNIFGITLVTTDGKVYSIGDTTSEVSIQSISKVFTMARVIEESGTKSISDNMGVDATGQAFNSIVAIEQYKGEEMNPMVNPGAITATSMIKGANTDAVWKTIIDTYSDFAGRKLSIDKEVYKSEAETNQRNRALAMLMHAYGRLQGDAIEATDIYTRQCSVSVNTTDLANMAATLANGGTNPVSGKKVVNSDNIDEILAVMATAGLYDDSGQWLYRTGLPAKSGVGGGILAVSPNKFGIAAISPPLDAAGNSIRAQRAITDISNALGGNPYKVIPK